MTLLSAINIGHYFGEREIMREVTFSIEDHSHVALIGVNGSGKTTLFRIIRGEYTPEEGTIVTAHGTKIGYMEQISFCGNRSVYDETLTVFDQLMQMEAQLDDIHHQVEKSGGDTALIEKQHQLNEQFIAAGGLTYRSRTKSALTGLGFDERMQQQNIDTLSGGQRSKVQLCKLLLSGANLLLLDEPTNHLDIAATKWLEDFLLSYNGAYIVVSHDRYFLDKIIDTTMELENRRLKVYKGNYSRYLELKMTDREIAQRHYENTRREMKRIEGIIEQQKRWNQERNYVTAASKQKQLDRLAATLVKVDSLPQKIHFSFPVHESTANEVLSTDRLALDYGTKHVFSEVNIKIMKRERVFLIGSNGCGKSSLFKVLASKIPGKCGSFTYGPGIECGYFDQTMSNLHEEKTVIDEVWDRYPTMTETQIRSSLAIFLFRGDDVFKKIANLSGGERAKLSILLLMLSKANFLLLDEPTNHLDIASREALEQALTEYEGTLFIVSHDRFFVNKLADRLYYMDEHGLTEYLGDYDYFESHRPQEQTAAPTSKAGHISEYKQRKNRESEIRKRKGQIDRTEKKIEEISERLSELNELMSTPEYASDYAKVMELTEQINALTAEEEQLYSLLEELYEQDDQQ